MTDPPEHLLNIFEAGEVDQAATLRRFRIVRTEGKREVEAKADAEYARYRVLQDAQPRAVDAAFEKVAKQLRASPPRRTSKKAPK